MGKEKYIAVMGVTGAGKSSFIKLVTGDDSIKVGESLVSETQELGTYKFRHKDRTIVLVDTPGFDDTTQKDADILKLLADWLESMYRAGTKLSGIIYLHRISDDRMRGSSMRSMRMFRKLCGESFYRNLLLGTTCWSLISEEIGVQREKELMTDQNFWKGLIAKGAQFVRIPDDGWDAKELVYDLARMEPASLQIQEEMVDQHINFNDLSAAQTLDHGSKALQEAQEKEKRRLQEEHQRQVDEQNRELEQQRLQLEQEKQIKLRQFQLETEHSIMAESKSKFQEGITNSIYMAKLYPFTSSLGITCDGCCRWLGNDPYYSCPTCHEGAFRLCNDCYSSKAVFCHYPSHHSSMRMITIGDGPLECRHIRSRMSPEAVLPCYRCSKNIMGVFSHCCSCLDDNFNMCLQCLTELGTCKKSWSLSGHRLHPILRRQRYQLPSDQRPPVQSTPEVVDDDTKCLALQQQGMALREEENWIEAESRYLQVLQIKRDRAPEDEFVRTSRYCLGIIYQELNRFDAAASMYLLAMGGQEKSLGPDHGTTLLTAYRIALIYMKQEKNEEAVPMFLRAIQREKELGATDEVVRTSRYNLGLLQRKLGNYSASRIMYEMALKAEEETLGVESESTLTTLSELANVYKLLDWFDDSEKCYLRLLAAREKSLGKDSKRVLDTCYNTALLYRKASNNAAAETYFRRACIGYEATLGPNDSETLEAMDKLAEVLVLEGKTTEVADLYRTISYRRHTTIGSDDELTKTNAQSLSEVQSQLDELNMTRPSFQAPSPTTEYPTPQNENRSNTWSPNVNIGPTTNVQDAKLSHTLFGHSKTVQAVKFSPSNTTLASGGNDATVRLWDSNTGSWLSTLTGHKAHYSIEDLAFAPDGNMLASASSDKTIQLWDMRRNASVQTLVQGAWAYGVAISPDGTKIAAGLSNDKIQIWDSRSMRLLHNCKGHKSMVRSVAFSPNGKRLASTGNDKTVRVWDPQAGEILHTIKAHPGMMSYAMAVAFSPDGKTIASGALDSSVKLWKTETGEAVRTLKSKISSQVKDLAFSPDGKRIAVGQVFGQVEFWSAEEGFAVHSLKAHEKSVEAVTFSSDGKLLATGSGDKTIKIWRF